MLHQMRHSPPTSTQQHPLWGELVAPSPRAAWHWTLLFRRGHPVVQVVLETEPRLPDLHLGCFLQRP